MSKRLTRAVYIERAQKTHGDIYDYALWSEVICAKSKVTSWCNAHGFFTQTLDSHCRDVGCPSCKGGVQLSRVTRIQQATAIHGDKYDYSLLPETVTAFRKVDIICSKHGVFQQTLDNHINGKKGCRSCTPTGFKPNKIAYLYFLKSDFGVKIGITGNLENRMTQLETCTPFKFHFIGAFKGQGRVVKLVEKILHECTRSSELSGFTGCTEWRILDNYNLLDTPQLFGLKPCLN